MNGKSSKRIPHVADCADLSSHTEKKNFIDTTQTMLLQIPIENTVLLCFVMHEERDAFFAGEVEQRTQCIFELDALLAGIVV